MGGGISEWVRIWVGKKSSGVVGKWWRMREALGWDGEES